MMNHLRVIWFFPRLLAFWRSSNRLRLFFWLSVVLAGIILLVALRPPSSFPETKILTVRENISIMETGEYLHDHSAITSPFLFSVFVKLFNNQNGVLSGSYYFEKPVNLVTVAYRISRGEFGLTPLTVTIPEGNNIFQVAEIVARIIPDFNKENFIELAQGKEGYLFPDTYYFLPTVTAREVITAMEKIFHQRIAFLEEEIRNYGRPLSDVIKMASYLEEEARLTHTRRMVAGILWKRFDIEMPLQIDASFQYVNGKNTFQLTLDDLKIDSPYNTYVYVGLTPTPISNPGLDSIRAAVTPIESEYLFFLSDNDGTMHYAITHDEHVENKNRYLR